MTPKTPINVTLKIVTDKNQKSYRAYLGNETDQYLLKITPASRMGCTSLLNTSGVVQIEICEKNTQYPRGFEYSDSIYNKPHGGRELHASVFNGLTDALHSCGILSRDAFVQSFVFTENEREHRIQQ